MIDAEKLNTRRENNKRTEVEIIRDYIYSTMLKYHDLTLDLTNYLFPLLE